MWVSSTLSPELLHLRNVKSNISKGDIDSSEYANFQEVEGWCILCSYQQEWADDALSWQECDHLPIDYVIN